MKTKAGVVQRSSATVVTDEGGGSLAMSARFQERGWSRLSSTAGRSTNREEDVHASDRKQCRACHGRNASASIKMKRIVCMLYVLGASHHVQRTWNILAVSALSTKTVVESATTQAAH